MTGYKLELLLIQKALHRSGTQPTAPANCPGQLPCLHLELRELPMRCSSWSRTEMDSQGSDLPFGSLRVSQPASGSSGISNHRAWLHTSSLLLLHGVLSLTAEYDFLETAFPKFKITLSPIRTWREFQQKQRLCSLNLQLLGMKGQNKPCHLCRGRWNWRQSC